MKRTALLFTSSLALFVVGCEPATETTEPVETAAKTNSDAAESIPCPFTNSKDWKAWINKMPGPDAPKLIVIGQLEVGSDGYAGNLKNTGLGKKNPPIQMLDLTMVESTKDKKGWQEVRFETQAQPAYDSVTITCHGEAFATIDEVGEAN